MLRRWVSALSRGAPEARRVAAAVRRAVHAQLFAQYRRAAFGAGLAGAALFALHWYWAARSGAGHGIASGFLAALSLGLGAATACGAVDFSVRIALRASLPAVSAVRSGGDALLGVTLRAGGAAALISETVGVLAMLLMFGVVFGMGAGLGGPAVVASDAAVRSALLLPSFGVGAALASMIVCRSGSLYRVTSEIAPQLVVERHAGIHADDARSPGVVARLVGDHVGRIAVKAADDFATATLATTVGLAAAAATYILNPQYAAASLALASLPIVVRGFGLVGAAFGLVVARNDTSAPRSSALWRGQFASHVIAIAGLTGTCIWMLGDRWMYVGAAGTIVLASVCTLEHLLRLRVRRRSRALKELSDSQRSGEAPLLAHVFGHGLGAPLLALLILTPAFALAWQLGTLTDAQAGGSLALLASLAVLLAVAPYMSALAHSATLTQHAIACARMIAPDELPAEVRALEDTRQSASSMGQSHQALLTGALVLVAAAEASRFAVQGMGMGAESVAAIANLNPLVLVVGALGAAFVLGLAGAGLIDASRGIRAVASEIERQLRHLPRSRGRWQIPSDFVPSYRSCVDLAGKTALGRILPASILALAGPAALALLLQVLYSSSAHATPVHGLAMFTAVAGAASLVVVLTADSAHQLLTTAIRGPHVSPSSPSALPTPGNALAIGILASSRVGAEANLLIKVTALLTLALAPFIA